MNEPSQDLSKSLPLPPLPPKLSYAIENIDSILNDQIVSTRDQGMRRYLIKWKRKPDSENSWLTEGDLRHFDPDRLERYQCQQQFCSSRSTESSPFHPGGIDKDIMSLRADSIEYTLGSDAMQFFGFRLDLSQIYL